MSASCAKASRSIPGSEARSRCTNSGSMSSQATLPGRLVVRLRSARRRRRGRGGSRRRRCAVALDAVNRFEPDHLDAPVLLGRGGEELLLPGRPARAERRRHDRGIEWTLAADEDDARPALMVEIDAEPVAAAALVEDGTAADRLLKHLLEIVAVGDQRRDRPRRLYAED